jgi:hypothetical protein
VRIKRDDEFAFNYVELVADETNEETYAASASITCPGWQKTLAIRQPVLAMIIKVRAGDAFTFEATVLDDRGATRRVRASTYQRKPVTSDMLCHIPLTLERGSWCYLPVDLGAVLTKAYARTKFAELLRVQIHGSCQLRRVFCCDRMYTEQQLPVELRLCKRRALPKPDAASKSSAATLSSTTTTSTTESRAGLDQMFKRPRLDDALVDGR